MPGQYEIRLFEAARAEVALDVCTADLETVCARWVENERRRVQPIDRSPSYLGRRKALQDRATELGLPFTMLNDHVRQWKPHLLTSPMGEGVSGPK